MVDTSRVGPESIDHSVNVHPPVSSVQPRPIKAEEFEHTKPTFLSESTTTLDKSSSILAAFDVDKLPIPNEPVSLSTG